MKIVCPVCGKWRDNWKREVTKEPVNPILSYTHVKVTEWRVCKNCGHKEVVSVTEHDSGL